MHKHHPFTYLGKAVRVLFQVVARYAQQWYNANPSCAIGPRPLCCNWLYTKTDFQRWCGHASTSRRGCNPTEDT